MEGLFCRGKQLGLWWSHKLSKSRNYIQEATMIYSLSLGNSSLRYSTLNKSFAVLARLIMNNKDMSASVLSTVNWLAARAQQKQPLEVIFATGNTNSHLLESKAPVRGVLRPPTNGLSQTRKRSRNELFKSSGSFRKNRSYNLLQQGANTSSPKLQESELLLPVSGSGLNAMKCCSFWKKPGHNIGNPCPKIHFWGDGKGDGKLLPRGKNAVSERIGFCTSLRGPSTNLQIMKLPNDQIGNLPCTTNISTTVKGIVIHNRFVHNNSVIIDCTLLVKDGEPCKKYTQTLFCVESVCKIISNSYNRVVISQLKIGLQQQEMAIGAAQPNSVVLDTGAGVAMLPFPHCSQQFVLPAPYYNLSQVSQPTSEHQFGFGFEDNSSNNIDYTSRNI